MTEPRLIEASQRPTAKGQGPTAIPEGKRRCSLNAYRHGMTGQIVVKTPEEQQAYDQHCRIILEALSPATDFERLLAQSIADDRWRLNRAGADNTGNAQVDDAFSQARTWAEQAHNLALLTIYEQRIQRSVDKNTAQLQALQAKRIEQADLAMKQAKLLYQLAQAGGKPYQPEAFFVTAPRSRESVFSTAEIDRDLSRAKLLTDAEKYDRNLRPMIPPRVTGQFRR